MIQVLFRPFRVTVRLLVAAMLSYGIAAALGQSQGWWAVITSLLIVQATAGGTLRAALDRFAGTAIGGLSGAVAAMLVSAFDLPHWLGLLIALVPSTWAASWQPRYRVAPVTTVIVMLGNSIGSPLETVASRLGEIGLGNLVGILVTFLIVPGRASDVLHGQTADLLTHLIDLATLYLGAAPDPADADAVSKHAAKIRANLAALEAGVSDAHLEHLLAGQRSLEALPRTLRRVYNDIIFIGRAAGRQPPAHRLDNATLAPLRAALADWLHAASVSALTGTDPPALDRLDAARLSLFPDEADPGAFAFAVGNLVGNLRDLSQRLIDLKG